MISMTGITSLLYNRWVGCGSSTLCLPGSCAAVSDIEQPLQSIDCLLYLCGLGEGSSAVRDPVGSAGVRRDIGREDRR